MDESILFFSRVSLSKFSLEALFLSWVKGVFILGWEWNVKIQVFQNRAGSRLNWVASSNREVIEWPVVLFCPVKSQVFQNRAGSQLNWVASSNREVIECPVVLFCPVELQLAWRLNFWHAWHVCSLWRLATTSHPRDPVASPCFSCTLLS